MEFVAFPKIPRLKRDITITEKIDGTNAQIVITEDGDLLTGSRNRWITPESDNYGFARWAQGNRDELLKLGVGQHFGEWYGSGIQRGYGLSEKRFALFNTARWGEHNPPPACCEVVPVLYHGTMADTSTVLERLRYLGSVAVPGFAKPEGIIVYHSAAQQMFKVLLENDEIPKGLAKAA
jgi:hypothetical protein